MPCLVAIQPSSIERLTDARLSIFLRLKLFSNTMFSLGARVTYIQISWYLEDRM